MQNWHGLIPMTDCMILIKISCCTSNESVPRKQLSSKKETMFIISVTCSLIHGRQGNVSTEFKILTAAWPTL